MGWGLQERRGDPISHHEHKASEEGWFTISQIEKPSRRSELEKEQRAHNQADPEAVGKMVIRKCVISQTKELRIDQYLHHPDETDEHPGGCKMNSNR